MRRTMARRLSVRWLYDGAGPSVLTEFDAALVQREGAIPGLATVLDPQALVAALGVVYPSMQILAATAFYVHYKPGRRCIVAYHMKLANLERPVLTYADAYGPGREHKLPKARELARQALGPLAQYVLVLEQPGIAVYLFPADRRLKALRRLAQQEEQHALLRQALGIDAQAADCKIEHLRYKPERRYVARVEVAGKIRGVLKFYGPSDYQAAANGARAFVGAGRLQVIEPVKTIDKLRLLAFDWHSGQPLDELLLTRSNDEATLQSALNLTGAALAELHRQVPDTLPQRDANAEQRRIRAQAETVALLCPELETKASKVAGALIDQLPQLPARASGLHGDFNSQQVLITAAESAALLDFDRASLGHPAIDLGNFAAFMRRDVLDGKLDAGLAANAVRALHEGYQQVGDAPGESEIMLCKALGLFYLGAESFRYRAPDWLARIDRLLDECVDILNAVK